MKTTTRILGALLIFALAASLAAALERPAGQTPQAGLQLQAGAQDVITASDAGGGYLSTRDIILIVIIVFAVIGFIAVFA